MERTLVLIKPDAVARELIGTVISRFERRGMKIVGMKMIKITPELSKEHYAHLVDKPFYPELENFMTHMPVVAMVLDGKNAVSVVRKFAGVTDASKAEPGTLRGDFAVSVSKNIIHASDSLDSAKSEIRRFFKEDELFDYERMDYYYSSDEK